MKKLLALGALAILMVSCGSSPSRGYASVERDCALEKHPSKNHYRILIHEKPHSQYWYTKSDALKIKDSFSKKGMCE